MQAELKNQTQTKTIIEWIKERRHYVKDFGGEAVLHVIHAVCLSRQHDEMVYWYICKTADGDYVQAYKDVYVTEEITIYLDRKTAEYELQEYEISDKDIEQNGRDSVIVILHDTVRHRALVLLATHDDVRSYYIGNTDGLFVRELSGIADDETVADELEMHRAAILALMYLQTQIR